MRVLAIVLILATGCGGTRKVGTGAGSPAGEVAQVAAVFRAARWIPASPTYAVAARTVRDAQRALGDLADTFGLMVGVERAQIAGALAGVLAVDPLSADAIAQIGIDLDGGIALFSEDVNPTVVIQLASPPALQAFFDRQRERGMVTQSVVVDGSEVFSTQLDAQLRLSWVVDGDWLWVHFGGADDGTAWLTQSRRPAAATWVARWQAAQQLASGAAGVAGIANLRDLAAKVAARTGQGVACARQLDNVAGVGAALEGEGGFVGARIAIDLASAQGIAQRLLAPPPGWAAASASAPLAAQWNLDVGAVAAWLAPCAPRANLAALVDRFGVRSGRAFVHSLDPDDKSGTGAISLDLSHRRYFAQLLDQIPMRTKFERSRAFGAYQGKHLSVPFVATVDYVLDDRVFLAAMGDGMLERAAIGPAAAPPALLAIDVVPRGFSVDVWQWLFEQADLPSPARLAERLQRWRDIHIAAHLDRDRLVIEAQGNRR